MKKKIQKLGFFINLWLVKKSWVIFIFLFKCDSNLVVYSCYVNCLDPAFPRLAFFAKRDIAKNEEITFDYLANKSDDGKLKTLQNIHINLNIVCFESRASLERPSISLNSFIFGGGLHLFFGKMVFAVHSIFFLK